MEKKIKTKECKFVHYIPYVKDERDDTHLVKEKITYEDNTIENKINVISNFKRPIWITKLNYRNHKQKKESEELSKLVEYQCTQNDIPKEANKRLNMNRYNPTIRDVSVSPYLYGIDVDSRVFVKKAYLDKYGEEFTPYSVCVLDIEVDIDTNELIIITVATNTNSYTAVLKKFVNRYNNPEKELRYIYKKHIPETDITKNINIEFGFFNTEIELISNVFEKVHSWKPDFLAVWNISYDLGVMLRICDKYNVDPKDIFSDPDLPTNLRYFKYIEDKNSKVTASGVNKPPGPHERWHKIVSSASFYWVDAMCAYNYIRVGGKAVVGGYSLDSVLKHELGDKLKKLKFEDENTNNLLGADWHRYMVNEKPLEYIVYNIWDVLSILELDKKTTDLSTSLALLSGLSSFDNFKSGPKKIVDNLHFFYINNGRVLGCRSRIENNEDFNKDIDLSKWIVLLPSHRVKDNGYKCLNDAKGFNTNIKTFTFDADKNIKLWC